MNDPRQLAERLVQSIACYPRCIVAFSGGVDSSVIAQAALFALGYDQCLAVTAESPSVSQFELETAQAVAKQIGIQHQILQTAEINNPLYVMNDGNRCFHCKSELYLQLQSIAEHTKDSTTILNGTNADDRHDYRPGLQAAANFQIKSPLADLNFGKSEVRQIAKFWDLQVWDKPASPCLASRIAYGESVTAEKLQMVEQAESVLRSMDFQVFRVRYHAGALARIEVQLDELDRLLQPENRQHVVEQLKSIGFQIVSIDAEGFRSGNLNQSLVSLSAELKPAGLQSGIKKDH